MLVSGLRASIAFSSLVCLAGCGLLLEPPTDASLPDGQAIIDGGGVDGGDVDGATVDAAVRDGSLADGGGPCVSPDGSCCDRYVVPGGLGSADGLSPESATGQVQAAVDSLPDTGGTVCVAAEPHATDTCAEGVYPEDLVMRDGARVIGGHDPATWNRLAGTCFTTLAPAVREGVVFPASTGPTTALVGFLVSPTATGSRSAAITMVGAGEVSENSIFSASTDESVGVHVTSDSSAPAGAIQILDNIVESPSALARSLGVLVQSGDPLIRGNRITAGRAPESAALRLTAGSAMIVENLELRASPASDISAGVYASRTLTPTITRNAAISGAAEGAGARAYGVYGEDCGGALTVSGNGSIVGGSSTSQSVGVGAARCSLDVRGNASITGGHGGEFAAGVDCLASRCRVGQNAYILGHDGVGPTPRTSVGVIIADSTGPESAAVITVNGTRGPAPTDGIRGCETSTVSCHGVLLENVSQPAIIRRNVFLPNGGGTESAALLAIRSVFTFGNNLVRVGRGSAISYRPTEAVHDSTINFNTIIGSGSAPLIVGRSTATATFLIGHVSSNNIVCAGGAAISASGMSWAVVRRNNMFGCFLSSAFSVGNFSVDPVFVNAAGGDYHLQARSPLVNRAILTSIALRATLANDFDGDTRDDVPDVGFDEVPAP